MKNKKIIGRVLSGVLLFPTMMLGGCSTVGDTNQTKVQTYTRTEVITSAQDAQKLLNEGNTRFRSGQPANKNIGEKRRTELKNNGQHPFAIIVSCSDSRVPPEIVFDQALGDLFEVRVAGNIIDKESMGSVEYAVEHLKSPLIVVMGHEQCGAVTAAVKGGEAPGSIGSILDKIQPSVDKAKDTGVQGDALIEKAAELNVENSIAELESSPVIKEAIEQGKLKIVGAKYQLVSGKVLWLESK